MAAPPDTVDIVGMMANNNGRNCLQHNCCGETLILNAPNNGIGLKLRLRRTNRPNQLAAYVILPNGNDGCRVGFTKDSFAEAWIDVFDGALVEVDEVYTTNSPISAHRRLYHRNVGFGVATVVELQNNN